MRDKLLLIGFCAAGLVACDGSGGSISFQDLCARAAQKICDEINACSSPVSKPECIAQIKAANCPGGPEQYCGATGIYQPSKAPACLDALNASGCELLQDQPPECTREVMCSAVPGSSQGDACEILEPGYECGAKASTCYGAGESSSCAAGGLCIGDSKGVFCAALCSVDADCAAAGTGLVCIQGCKASLLNGFCVSPQTRTKFLQGACANGSASTTGMSGWSM